MAEQPWRCIYRDTLPEVFLLNMLGFCPQEHRCDRKHKRLGIKETQARILVVVSLLALHELCEHYFLIFQIGTIIVPISQDCESIKSCDILHIGSSQ